MDVLAHVELRYANPTCNADAVKGRAMMFLKSRCPWLFFYSANVLVKLTNTKKENMKVNNLVYIVLLAGSSQVLAQQAKTPVPSEAELRAVRISVCELSADKARSIASATIKAKKYNADAEVLAQTIEGSPDRNLMQKLFQRDDLISTVLIRSASFGASAIPAPEGDEYKKDIAELTYRYVRSTCIAATLAR
jgi:hypothetical protein